MEAEFPEHGKPRTVGSETLLAASLLVGHMETFANRMQPDMVERLSRILAHDIVEDAELKFRLDPKSATTDEKREELERWLRALKDRLKHEGTQLDPTRRT